MVDELQHFTKRPNGIYNHNGFDVALLDRVWHGYCVDNLKFRTSIVDLCQTYAYELEIMASRLNFTVHVKIVHGNIINLPVLYIYPNFRMDDDYFVEQILSITYSQEQVPAVFYCRNRNIFSNTWTVWLTPFNWTVWITIVALLAAASIRKMAGTWDVKLVLFEIYLYAASTCKKFYPSSHLNRNIQHHYSNCLRVPCGWKRNCASRSPRIQKC